MINQITSLTAIKALSYWRYTRMKRCQLSGAYPAAVVSPAKKQATSTRFQLIGKLFHSGMEQVNKQITASKLDPKAFRNSFNALVDEMSDQVLRDSATRHFGKVSLWPEVGDVYSSLRKVLEIRRNAPTAAPEVHSEETLYSKDQLLFGQLDAFFQDADGIDLVDYKSGAMTTEDALPKEDYVNQLYFYAYLIEQNFGIYPKSLYLTGKKLDSINIAPSSERSDAIAKDMRLTLQQYNTTIELPNYLQGIASPSLENCVYCDAKSVCTAFWKSASGFEFPASAHAVIGLQSSPFQRSRHGACSMTVAVEQGSIAASELVITRVFESRFPELCDNVGQRLMLLNIRLLSPGPPALCEATDRAIILNLNSSANEK